MARGVYGLADSKFPIWFEFGRHPATNRVDVADINGDVICNVTRDECDELCARYNKLQAMVGELGQALDNIDHAKFREIWGDL